MALNNLDKNIQQKFNSRKIEPSAQAWDRLDAMLTVAEEKKQPKNYFWLKIAASFLLFSGMGYIFFQQNQKFDAIQPKNEVVISNEKTSSDSNNTIENNSETIEKETYQNETITANELAITTPKTANSITKKVSHQKENTQLYKSKLETYIAAAEKETLIQNENKTEQINRKATYNYVNPESLLAEVQGNKKTNGNTNTYKSTLKVNSSDLLNSVESELDQSFKDKALSRFKQAKSAFVNRNYN